MASRPAWLLLCALLGLGCAGPPNARFSVSPRVLCEGDTAVMRWEADGELGIGMEMEPEARAGDCAAKGRETYALTLVARKGDRETSRRVEVVQLHGRSAEPVVLQTNAVQGGRVIATGEKNVALWSDRVEVETVAACGHRALTVRHSGRNASLGPDGASSDALAGSSLAGSWELSSPLTPAEQADPSLRPSTLSLLATLRCRQETP